MAFELFGFKIERKSQESPKANVPVFTLPENEDGSVMVSGAGAYGSYVDFDGQYKNEVDLIYKYREMSMTADCEVAIDNIVNEAVVIEENKPTVEMILEGTDLSKGIKNKINGEFENILHLLNFNNYTIVIIHFFHYIKPSSKSLYPSFFIVRCNLNFV